MLERNSLLAWLAASAFSFAKVNSSCVAFEIGERLRKLKSALLDQLFKMVAVLLYLSCHLIEAGAQRANFRALL